MCHQDSIHTECLRRIRRWKHEDILEEFQRPFDANPQAMLTRRETVEHPFGTIKARVGELHFHVERLHSVNTEISLAGLAYILTRVINIVYIPA